MKPISYRSKRELHLAPHLEVWQYCVGRGEGETPPCWPASVGTVERQEAESGCLVIVPLLKHKLTCNRSVYSSNFRDCCPDHSPFSSYLLILFLSPHLPPKTLWKDRKWLIGSDHHNSHLPASDVPITSSRFSFGNTPNRLQKFPSCIIHLPV